MAKHVIQNLDEDFLQCAICMDRYKEPVMLPCLHSFCLPCLDKSDKGINVESFACPTCRRSVKLTESGFRSLPSNFFLESLVERLSLIEKLSAESASKCELCQAKGSGLFCLDCQLHFCEGCKSVHSNLPGMDEHTIISAEKLSDQKYIEEITAGQAPRCKKHKQEKLRLYCKTCNELLCRDCTLVDHQGHKCVEIQNEFLDAKTRIQGRIERGKEQAQVTHELTTDFKLSSQKIEDQTGALCKQIDEHAEKMIEKIKSDRASLKKSLEESKTSKNVPLLRTQSDATKWMEAMENTNKVAERVIEGHNPWEILAMERKLHDTFDKLDSERTSFRSPKKDNPLADDVDLKYDPEITTSSHKDYAFNPLKLPNVLGRLKSGASKERKPRHSKAAAGPLGVLMSCICLSVVVGALFLVSTMLFDIECNYPRDCDEAVEDSACHSFFRRGGTDRYLIQPGDYPEPFEAVCKSTTNGTWTVIQRRYAGWIDFDRSWNDYKQGFGDLDDEFWLGNDRIHYLTNQGRYELTIDMIATNGKAYQMNYTSFRIGDESTHYTLEEVGEMSPKDERNRLEGILITCVNGVCDNHNLIIKSHKQAGIRPKTRSKTCDYRTPTNRYQIGVADGFAVNLTLSSFHTGDGRDIMIIDEGETGRRTPMVTLSEQKVMPFSVLSSTSDVVVEFVHSGIDHKCDGFVASVQGYHNLLDSPSVDALTNHLGKPFATSDHYWGNCTISGGWWHGNGRQFIYRGRDYCGHSNLNGEFMAYTPQGIQWMGLPHERRTITYTEMRIKKTSNGQ